MPINKRKPFALRNRTNYFNPAKDRVLVRVQSPYSYRSRQSKIEGYENRLYWEFLHCLKLGGQTFFYTLTYNDKNIPNYEGQNCFDYNDLVYLLNGGFKKQLLRKYGTNFKYFVGAELGDGKGDRGLHNNPHYHILFFTYPDESSSVYKRITPVEFRHLVKMYWQGFDEYATGYHDYKSAKFGIAKEGNNLGLVTDFRACIYCAKYVCKDVKLKNHEELIVERLKKKFLEQTLISPDTKVSFYYDYLCSKLDFPFISGKSFLPQELLSYYDTDSYSILINNDFIYYDEISKICFVVDSLISSMNLESDYNSFCQKLTDDLVKKELNVYRNRYCNKCRISNGVGEYALENLEDKLNPKIKIPSKKGFKYRPIGLYYYRKLFTNVEKDAMGNPIYVLNDLGIEYKCTHLLENKDKLIRNTVTNLALLDEKFFNEMYYSDVNTDVTISYKDYRDIIDNDDLKEILQRYANYKLVYQDRFFTFSYDSKSDAYSFPALNVLDDYRSFLRSSYYDSAYNPFAVGYFLQADCEGYISYDAHSAFLRYSCVFRVFDLLSDYLFVQSDVKFQKEAEERAKIRRFHRCLDLVNYYDQFAV